MAEADVTALRAKYTAACAEMPWGEAAAVAVLLAYEPVASRSEFARHVTRSGVHWAAVLAEAAWWPEARFIIATAAGLWTGSPYGADVCRVTRLDDSELAAWQAMVTARLTGKVPVMADERAEVRRVLDENPAFARVLRQFTALYDAAEVIDELKPPEHQVAAPYLREIADHVIRETGIGEDFLRALICGRPPAFPPVG